MTTPTRAVTIKATDYNGETWDGFPLSAMPAWLFLAIERGEVAPVAADRDYALWRVNGGAELGEPGDQIVRDGHGVKLVKAGGAQ